MIPGPLKTSFPPSWAESHLALFDTAEKLGIPRNPEAVSDHVASVSQQHANLVAMQCNGRNNGSMTSLVSGDADTAKRSYSASAYLEPNIDRPNLLVLTEAHVTKVLLERDDELQRARGVEFVVNGTTHRVENVRFDVVVSGGKRPTSRRCYTGILSRYLQVLCRLLRS